MSERLSAGRNSVRASGKIVIDAMRDGDWLPLQEFLRVALSAAGAESDITLNLEGLDYLDAGALQIVVALTAEGKKRGRLLHTTNASVSLSQWFEYAGAKLGQNPDADDALNNNA